MKPIRTTFRAAIFLTYVFFAVGAWANGHHKLAMGVAVGATLFAVWVWYIMMEERE